MYFEIENFIERRNILLNDKLGKKFLDLLPLNRTKLEIRMNGRAMILINKSEKYSNSKIETTRKKTTTKSCVSSLQLRMQPLELIY